MSERAYTVAEIDALRDCHETKYLYGFYSWPEDGGGGHRMSRTYQEKDKTVAVEQMVRTSMLAGHTAVDLIAHEKSERDKWALSRRYVEDGTKGERNG